jgi:hypothetical protein
MIELSLNPRDVYKRFGGQYYLLLFIKFDFPPLTALKEVIS